MPTVLPVLPLAIPGPRPMPLLGWRGNVLRCARDPLRYLSELHRRHGDVAALVRGGNRNLLSAVATCPGTVAVFSPKYNREVLGNPDLFHMGLVTGLEGTPLERLGAGMFNLNGDAHKQLRRAMAPSFHKSWMELYHRDLVDRTGRMLEEWRPGQRRDIQADMDRLVFRSAAANFCGLMDDHAVDGLGALIRRWVKMAYAPAVRLMPINWPGMPYRRFLQLSQQLDAALAGLLQHKRAASQERNLLGTLLQAGSPELGLLTEGQCVGQVLTLFIGAHDAPAAALAWTFFLLSQHPRILADLVDELHGELRGAAPTLDQLNRLPLLDSVVKESMRLLPPVPVAGRYAARPASLGPYHLAAGTEVLYSQYITHRLPDIYPQPARFRPDRWNGFQPSPYEYLPFGGGPRRCLGSSLGPVQIQTVLAMVLQRYRPQLVPTARLDRVVHLTMRPRRGMPMQVHAQDRRFVRGPAAMRGNVWDMVDWS